MKVDKNKTAEEILALLPEKIGVKDLNGGKITPGDDMYLHLCTGREKEGYYACYDGFCGKVEPQKDLKTALLILIESCNKHGLL